MTQSQPQNTLREMDAWMKYSGNINGVGRGSMGLTAQTPDVGLQQIWKITANGWRLDMPALWLSRVAQMDSASQQK
jgi:hypothetical protein